LIKLTLPEFRARFWRIGKFESFVSVPETSVDQYHCKMSAKNNIGLARQSGTPNIRQVYSSRITPGPADVDDFIKSLIISLTSPLTEEEKKGGKWTPENPRILFEGTLNEAETFYQQTRHVPPPLDAPIAIYSDGFPVRIPTEERVKEILCKPYSPIGTWTSEATPVVK